MMERWRIIAENFIGYAIVRDGLVIQADRELADLMGMSWDDAQKYCTDRDWSGHRVRNRRPRIHHPAIGQHSVN
jgi:hypothetical protein